MSLIAAPFAILAILYAGGFLAQLLGNYATWKQGGGIPGDGTSPLAASPDFLLCLSSVLRPPYGVYGILICIGLLAVLLIMVMRMGYGDAGEYDEDRNFSYSAKGTYGTSGWMSRKEMSGVLDLVPDLRKHKGVVLGMLDGKAVCIPEDTRINSNLAVYGASGSMKTRSFCMNRILQATVRGENGAGESLIICDPKSELYEKSSEFLRSRGYCVKVFNLVSPENSDSWCCLAEVEGQELMAQLFVDVIIKNTTNNGKSDHFWDACEMNLLKALVLYVDQGYAEENRNIGEVYQLLTLNGESQLDTLFEALPSTHPAKAPYSLFKQASDTVRSGVIIGLGSRLQVFQSELIKKITAKNEIDLELPGQQPCAYFLVTSDQDSTFDFLASLFLSFCFIKLVRYADHNCEGGKLPVPVHILGEELTACGTIPDLSRRLSVIRSRNISMSCVFQNLAGLQNRYPQNLWQEIIGNCDAQLFLGCTDQLTAEFISARTGLASVAVSSKSKQLGTWRISNYTPEFRETSGVGKRPVLTPDEVLRLPLDQALIIIRGKKVLQVDKMDYSKPKRTSRKKKEAAAPEEIVTEEVPAEAADPVATADTIPDAEEAAVEPDASALEEAAAPAPTSPPRRQPRPQRGEASVLTIRSRDDVETAEDRDDVIWHEIHNAYRTRKIITGKLGGIEQLDNRKTVAVVDYKGFRVIIPIKEMMINLGRSPSGQEYADLMLRQNKILGNMLGADIDFIVRGIDSKTRSVVASRKEAMLRKRQIFYLDTDAAGMYRVYEGRIVQARVIAVAEKVVRVEVFGVETSILARDLAWDWIGDAHERFSVGDEVLVRILSVRRNSLEDLGIKADIKSISENTDRDNLQKCRIQGKYAGRVTDVHKGVVYVRLSNGVNAVAHSCYDYRMPGKKDDVSFAVTRLDMERGVAVGIITRIIRQNL